MASMKLNMEARMVRLRIFLLTYALERPSGYYLLGNELREMGQQLVEARHDAHRLKHRVAELGLVRHYCRSNPLEVNPQFTTKNLFHKRTDLHGCGLLVGAAGLRRPKPLERQLLGRFWVVRGTRE